ncbi:uncharacterized protein YhaN [Bradyrhizobium ottawaense]
MRLRSLDLTRYGKFADHSIDLGERPTDQPDLHFIYEPDEAGKSTAFTASLDLLFGLRRRVRSLFSIPFPPCGLAEHWSSVPKAGLRAHQTSAQQPA